MALTIRTLSIDAKQNLNQILETNSFINSKTKAIEYALEQHEWYKEYKDKYYKALQEIDDLKTELSEIKNAINILKNL